MIDHYRMFAHYNRWANDRLYTAAAGLTDAEYRADTGAFFGSLHATLNHILVADRIWMKRFTGEGETMTGLDQILHTGFEELRADRLREDMRIIGWMEGLTDADTRRLITYTPVSHPQEITHPLGPALSHLFNHQTHHRGQCHTILTALGKPSLNLDLISFLRNDGARWMTPASGH